MTNGQQLDNPVECAWTLRALLTGMDRWVRQGTPPPASQHPRLADGTLVAGDQVAFPAIPGVASPRKIPAGRDGAVVWPLLVPQVDEDGNERAGIRAPVVAVPLATCTGLELPQPRDRRANRAREPAGIGHSVFAIADARARRAAIRGARSTERYPSSEAYLARIREVAQKLVDGRYLLAEDLSKGRRARPGALGPSGDDDEQSVMDRER